MKLNRIIWFWNQRKQIKHEIKMFLSCGGALFFLTSESCADKKKKGKKKKGKKGKRNKGIKEKEKEKKGKKREKKKSKQKKINSQKLRFLPKENMDCLTCLATSRRSVPFFHHPHFFRFFFSFFIVFSSFFDVYSKFFLFLHVSRFFFSFCVFLCLNPHLLLTMTDSARCTCEHSRFQSLSPECVLLIRH